MCMWPGAVGGLIPYLSSLSDETFKPWPRPHMTLAVGGTLNKQNPCPEH